MGHGTRFPGESRKKLVFNRLKRWRTGSSGRTLFRWGIDFSFKVIGVSDNWSPFDEMDGTEAIAFRAIAPVKAEDSAVFRGIHVFASVFVGKVIRVCDVFKTCADTLAKGHRPDIWFSIGRQVWSGCVPA